MCSTDALLFTKMLADNHICDLKKLHYKYPQADLREFVSLLKNGFYKSLPLPDFNGSPLVYLENRTQMQLSAAKVLLTPQNSTELFGRKAMENEIASSLTIEHIDFQRDSVRRILAGAAPTDDSESRIYGMKKGLEYISDLNHTITEENLHTLYALAIGDYLPEEDRLPPDSFYRRDSVYIIGERLEHTGLPWQSLPEYMAALTDFIRSEDTTDDLLKAAAIHFYIAYLHPYFDGNGRMARLVHLWYLVQRGYSSALFVPLSAYIEHSRKAYYNAYTLTEANQSYSGVLDITPFLTYFIENVYNKLGSALPAARTTESFNEALSAGHITEKESALWKFVLSAYGTDEFSTKQLERDFANAAYATVRGFVLKFEKLGLLISAHYGNRVKYRVNTHAD